MKKFLISTLVMITVFSAQALSKDRAEQDSLLISQEKPFDRGIGLPSSRFIPKGTVGGGLTVSYSSYNLGNGADDAGYKMLMSMLSGIDGDMQSFGLAPFVSYFIADNISVGLRFDYSYSDLNLGTADLSFGDMLSMNLQDLGYTKQSYMGAIALRDYIPIANSKRFAMFAELRAAGGYAQSESFQMQDGGKFGTYQDIYKCSIGLVPGLTCFVTNEIAIEASVGVLGYEYQKIVQTTNQVDVSQMVKNSANFKINLLSINLGMSFYIPSSANRVKKAR
ncbi:MAG: hypothetical protein UD961_06770 [Bacteroidales bacterium]|nr:hypothetical protein [Bacteroidales bacterium]